MSVSPPSAKTVGASGTRRCKSCSARCAWELATRRPPVEAAPAEAGKDERSVVSGSREAEQPLLVHARRVGQHDRPAAGRGRPSASR